MRVRPRRLVRTAHVPNASLSSREVTAALFRPLDVASAEQAAAARLGIREVVLFASARGALSASVRVLTDGDAAVPAYTCAAVPNAVVSAGRRPRFVDVDERGLVPPEAWPTDALPIVQDTYGFTAAAPAGRTFVRDAAHRAHPLRLDGAAVVVTSFEHSKSLSAGRGGLAATDDSDLAAALRRTRDTAPRTRGDVRGVLVTLTTLAMGRLDSRGRHTTAELFRKVAWHLDESRLLGQSEHELGGAGVDDVLLGPPGRGCARMIDSQLDRAAAIAAHRSAVVARYDLASGVDRPPQPLVRYPLVTPDPEAFERAMAGAGWDVRGRWFNGPIHPARTNVAAFGYTAGDAPTSERLARSVVNLPTHPLVASADADALIAAALAAGATPLG